MWYVKIGYTYWTNTRFQSILHDFPNKRHTSEATSPISQVKAVEGQESEALTLRTQAWPRCAAPVRVEVHPYEVITSKTNWDLTWINQETWDCDMDLERIYSWLVVTWTMEFYDFP